MIGFFETNDGRWIARAEWCGVWTEDVASEAMPSKREALIDFLTTAVAMAGEAARMLDELEPEAER